MMAKGMPAKHYEMDKKDIELIVRRGAEQEVRMLVSRLRFYVSPVAASHVPETEPLTSFLIDGLVKRPFLRL